MPPLRTGRGDATAGGILDRYIELNDKRPVARELAEVDLPVRRGDLLLGKYLIGETLGAGGMGVVVAAEHVQLGQKVAIKFLPTTLRQEPDRVTRFVREARAAARIRSEHVARVVDVSGPDSDVCYMVMEYLDGSDLAHLVRARGRLPTGEAVGYVLQACEAIAEAHGAGIVHRDLKPSNLFLTKRRDGTPLIKVLDFGISKVASSATNDGPVTDLTSTMAIMGSPVYMSPEQVRSSKTVDARTDIWSLGVILHELLTGKPVFVSESATELLAMIVADPPIPLRRIVPSIPASLEAIVLACLQKQPAERLPDVATLARRLQPLSPRWAATSVERILGGAEAASAPTAPVLAATEGRSSGAIAGGASPLSPGTTTSAQLSGELVPAEEARRRNLGIDVRPPVGAPSPTATVPMRRRRGVIAGTMVGGVIAVAAGALVLALGRSPQPTRTAQEATATTTVTGTGTQPAADAPSVRSLEKRPAAEPPALPLADPPRATAPEASSGRGTPEQPGVKVRDMSPEELAAADAKIAARATAEKAPRSPKAQRSRLADGARTHKAAPVASSEPALSSARPSAPLTPPPAEAKDPLDGRR